MDLLTLGFWIVFAVGCAVGYAAVSIAANIEVRRMIREFETWKEGQK